MDISGTSTWNSSWVLYTIFLSDGLSVYLLVAILAAMDFIFGAVKSGFENKYDNIIFITGFVGNALLAIILTYIGDRLGLPIYYVAILVFGSRLFDNLSIIRRHIVTNIRGKKRGK